MFRGSGTDNEKGRIEGPIYWFRIIAFQSGDIITFARGTELPITDLAAYQSTRGWDYLALSPTTIIEYSNDKCEIPAVTAGSINASGARAMSCCRPSRRPGTAVETRARI